MINYLFESLNYLLFINFIYFIYYYYYYYYYYDKTIIKIFFNNEKKK